LLDKREKTITRGATGIITLITHIATGSKFVWKEIPIIEGEEEKITGEVKIAMSVQSPFLVPIVDSFVEEERLYIVMPFFEKGTLATLLAEVKKSGKSIEEPVSVFFFIIFPPFLYFFHFFIFSVVFSACARLLEKLQVDCMFSMATTSSIEI
jgi:serine/threonine protein kinase